SEAEITAFKDKDQNNVYSSIYAIRRILFHPCPQNRTTGVGMPLGSDLIFYKNAQGVVGFEQKGLLCLTAQNDDTAATVTKEAVVFYIYKMAQVTLRKQKRKLIENNKENQSDMGEGMTLREVMSQRTQDTIKYFMDAKEMPLIETSASIPGMTSEQSMA